MSENAPVSAFAPFLPPLRMTRHFSVEPFVQNLGKRVRIARNGPACSAIALFRTGLSQSLHFTMPNSDLRGSAPKILMCFASSHCVGGDGGSETDDAEGDVGRLSQENVVLGGCALVGFSFKAIVGVGHLNGSLVD